MSVMHMTFYTLMSKSCILSLTDCQMINSFLQIMIKYALYYCSYVNEFIFQYCIC